MRMNIQSQCIAGRRINLRLSLCNFSVSATCSAFNEKLHLLREILDFSFHNVHFNCERK